MSGLSLLQTLNIRKESSLRLHFRANSLIQDVFYYFGALCDLITGIIWGIKSWWLNWNVLFWGCLGFFQVSFQFLEFLILFLELYLHVFICKLKSLEKRVKLRIFFIEFLEVILRILEFLSELIILLLNLLHLLLMCTLETWIHPCVFV